MYTIYSLPLSVLAKINNKFTTQFFDGIINTHPQIGKVCDNYYLINNNLTLNSAVNEEIIVYYNVFVQMSRQKAPIIQIVKD